MFFSDFLKQSMFVPDVNFVKTFSSTGAIFQDILRSIAEARHYASLISRLKGFLRANITQLGSLTII